MKRMTVDVDGIPASYLTVRDDGPVLLLLHGTYWSRVWQPVLEEIASSGLRPIAVDLRGLGRSAGELTIGEASVPALADWVVRFVRALDLDRPIAVAGHDIGGAIAQHLLVTEKLDVTKLALVNAATFDSWPVPGVARFRDPAIASTIKPEDIVAARRVSITAGLAAAATEDRIAEYLEPWTDPRVARSWLALAGAADSRYTMELLPGLQASEVPKLLVWGAVDTFQVIEYAERFVKEIPNSRLVRIPAGGHIPMENDPGAVASALIEFFE